MQDRPTAQELLEAVAEFLERDVLPLDGRVGFHGRVARNVVDIVRRELDQAPEADAAERAGLARLLGTADVDDLREANAELARRIREGALDDHRDEVLGHLRATTTAKLRIANPRELELWSASPHDRPDTHRDHDRGGSGS